MKEITINAYTFEELPKDIQERLIDEYKNEFDYSSDLEYYLKTLLEGLTNLNFNLEYLLHYSQSDGLRFTGHIEGCEINKLPFADLVKDAENTIINIDPAKDFSVSISVDADTCIESVKYYGDERKNLLTAIEEWYFDIRDLLEEEGYKYIEEVERDDYIRNCLIAIENLYMIDGRII